MESTRAILSPGRSRRNSASEAAGGASAGGRRWVGATAPVLLLALLALGTDAALADNFQVLPGQRVLLQGDSIVRGHAFGNYTDPSPLRTIYGIANLLLQDNLSHPPPMAALPGVWAGLNPDGTPKTVDTLADEIRVHVRAGQLRPGDWLIYEDAGELNMVVHPAPWPDAVNMYARQREALRGLLRQADQCVGRDHVLMMTMFDYDPATPWCRWDAPLDDGVHSGNDAIRDEAAAQGVRVIALRRMMDRAEQIVAAQGWGRVVGPDGIHPNVYGNFVMALAILGTLGGDVSNWKLDSLAPHFRHKMAGGDVATVLGFTRDPSDAERIALLHTLQAAAAADLREGPVPPAGRALPEVTHYAGHTFTDVIRHGRVLAHPAAQPAGTTRPVSYEVGMTLQLDRDHALLVASMREQGGHDFEVGNDAFVFRHLSDIRPERAIPINRLELDRPRASGHGTCILGKFPANGGFVPLGATLADGSPNPAAGTGFLISGSLPFLPNRTDGDPESGPDDRPFELVQLRWDGQTLRVTQREELFRLLGTRIGRIGLGNFCPQDRGFLCPFGPDDGTYVVVVRFDWDGQKWKATKAGRPFITAQGNGTKSGRAQDTWSLPVAGGGLKLLATPPKPKVTPRVYRYLETESSILRAGDHYLVHTRGADRKGRVYTSEDGLNYRLLFEHANHTVPQVLNQGLDGTLYLATNPGPGWLRNPLLAYAVHDGRVKEPVVLHDEKYIRGDAEKEVPFIDHPRGANIFLEGGWHHFLLYRVCDLRETNGQGAPPFPQTGLYLTELRYDQVTTVPYRF